MSIRLSKVYGDVTVELWSGNIGDMAISKLGPVFAASFNRQLHKAHVSNYMMMARIGDKVVGGMLFTVSGGWDDNDVMTYDESVLPMHRRLGVGSRMYDCLKTWAATAEEKIKVIYSHVDVGDKVGEAFMLSQEGFELFEEDDEELTFKYAF